MTNRSIAILGLAGIFILAACSSSSDDPSKTKTTAPSNATNPTNSNAAAVSTGAEVPPAQPADANTAAASSDQLGNSVSRMDNRLEAMRKAGQGGPEVDAATLAMKNARPAPDNSTFTSYLTDAGYEIRTFQNHPQLLKAEKKMLSDGKQSLKIFLRGGKVVEVPGQRVAILATAPAAALLEAAGIKGPAAPQKPSAPGSQGQKKSGE